jgi:uncharacterized protein
MATTSAQRIVTLDLIRGVAVMGIFSVNVIAFAMIEAAYFNPAAYGTRSPIDLAVWAANMLVIDGKMRTLFSMLFGASMLLVVERAEASGESGWWVHFRRMIVLLGFGLIHYFFIWFGDILTLYAVSGLVAFLFRKLEVRTLVVLGIMFLLANMLLFLGFIASQMQADVAAHAPNATADAIREWNQGLGGFYPDAAKIARDKALHLGSYFAFVGHNLKEGARLVPQILVFLPDTVGLMLLGMAGYRSGFLTGAWDDRLYRRIAKVAICIGLTGFAALIAYDLASGFWIIGLFAGFIVFATLFMTIMALGYAALIILLSRRHGWLAQRIAAAGRCAFTNYLGTSLIASLVFNGWGLGLYGSVSRAEAWLLVPIVWLLILAWSKPWLDRFHYGPFEWAWRSLARWKLQPMRKSPSPAPRERESVA